MMKPRKVCVALAIVALTGCLAAGGSTIAASRANAESDGRDAIEVLAGESQGGEVASQVAAGLEAITDRLVTAGVPVVGVSTEVPDAYTASVVAENGQPGDLLPLVCVYVPESSLSRTDGVLTMASIQRQAVFAVRDGVPLKLLCILSVDDHGHVENRGLMAASRLAPPSAMWNQPAKLSIASTQDQLRGAIDQAAEDTQVGVTSTSWSESADGRTVTISARWSGEGRPGDFVDLISTAVRLMNDDEGSKVITLVVEIESTSGQAIAYYVVDYEIGQVALGERIAPEHVGDPVFEPAIMR